MKTASSSSKLALCGILTALSLVIMLASGLIGILSLTAPMLAGGLLIVPVKQYGTSTALTMYAAVCLLGLFLTADKESALFYILFFGYYPVLQIYLDRIEHKALRCMLKGAIFYAGILLSIWLANVIFAVPIFESGESIIILSLIYIAALGGCFYLYDKALRQFFVMYDIRIRPKIEKYIR